MRSRVLLLSSTALCISLAVGTALLTASSAALAEEDADCQLTNTYAVKLPPELCRKLGGVPAAAEADVSDALYDIWTGNNRTDPDKAYGAATAYLTSFPKSRHADELRSWSAAYEKLLALRNTQSEVQPPRPSEAAPAAAPGAALPQPEAAPPEVAALPQPEAAPPAQPDAAEFDTAAAELAAWKSLEKSRSAADFRAFIEHYPDGEFAPSARRRLSALETAARARRQKAAAPPEPLHANEPPLETISIDGQTYIKGREPKTIGTVPLRAVEAD